jgi:hypothetical protein
MFRLGALLAVGATMATHLLQPASAQQPSAQPAPDWTTKYLQQEPAIGQLPTGAKVLVDDRTCPSGQIKQVIGGNVATGQPRVRSCIPMGSGAPD